MKALLKWVLFATIPVAISLQFIEAGAVPLFVLSVLAVLPVAAWIGVSTEHLAARMGPTYGALFNATFGNAAELIIAILAVRAGLLDVVKASFTGSILGNLLFVAGLAMLLGGWKREKQIFNTLTVESNSGQLVLAVSALMVPALFFHVGGRRNAFLMHEVSIGVSIVLMLTYFAGLWFAFRTHKDVLGAPAHGEAEEVSVDGHWSISRSILVLLASSALMAVVAEGLVEAVSEVGRQWGLNPVFLGFIVIAIVGNAAEHSTAVVLAMRNQMDTALNIVLQSSVQIALFVTPLIVFLSYPLGHPLDLVFTTFEILAVGLAVLIVTILSLNGESNWFEGFQLLALYAIVAVAIYFLPS